MAGRGAVIGRENLVIGSVAVTLASIPDNATMVRVMFSKQAPTGTVTGQNVVAFDYWDQDPNQGFAFTDEGGYFDVYGQKAIENLAAVALDGQTYFATVYYHVYPWQ